MDIKIDKKYRNQIEYETKLNKTWIKLNKTYRIWDWMTWSLGKIVFAIIQNYEISNLCLYFFSLQIGCHALMGKDQYTSQAIFGIFNSSKKTSKITDLKH